MRALPLALLFLLLAGCAVPPDDCSIWWSKTREPTPSEQAQLKAATGGYDVQHLMTASIPPQHQDRVDGLTRQECLPLEEALEAMPFVRSHGCMRPDPERDGRTVERRVVNGT